MATVTIKDGNLTLFCPACNDFHTLNLNPDNGKPCWTWDGNVDKPTIEPSINNKLVGADGVTVHRRCHSFVKHGHIKYLPDCTHSMAGKIVPLPVI